ncbi:outer membrane protein [Spongiimicrobium salis]|uniref:outer membrane protein n=1 Tax=Spongiimicrobium salis TaxID=1667022 RepID=UPI00374D299A
MMRSKHFLTAFLLMLPIMTYGQDGKDGLFLDLGLAYNKVGSGFNGENVLVSVDDVFAVPKFDAGIGFGVAMGYRYSGLYVELAYQRTTHDIDLSGVGGEAVHSMWSFTIRRLFLKEYRLQPFIQLGWVPLMPIRAKESALLVSQNRISDAIFIGDIANFTAGGGLEFALRPNMAIRLSAMYKRARYVSVESSEENVAISLEEAINADDVNVTLGVIFVL